MFIIGKAGWKILCSLLELCWLPPLPAMHSELLEQLLAGCRRCCWKLVADLSSYKFVADSKRRPGKKTVFVEFVKFYNSEANAMLKNVVSSISNRFQASPKSWIIIDDDYMSRWNVNFIVKLFCLKENYQDFNDQEVWVWWKLQTIEIEKKSLKQLSKLKSTEIACFRFS